MTAINKTNNYTIGQVVEKLKSKFSDITISKIRFLEDEGLIKPERTSSGYRKFKEEDIKRLYSILTLQKEQYLPLLVIKNNLNLIEEQTGKVTAKIDASGDGFDLDEQKKIGLKEAIRKTGLTKNQLEELKKFSVVEPNEDKGEISETDQEILGLAKRLSRFGLEPRHLKMYQNFANKEALLIYQIVAPYIKNKKRLEEKVSDLIDTSQAIKKQFLKKALLDILKKKS